ncbi:MAG TPA: PrsW family intramembrane metalloprotease [Methanomassiliicoccales archaeon]|nr:PrsW family intramembrane metalloprotease [Methanomassiliicoccales archaeon]
MADELLLIISLVFAAFAPPLIYMYIVRNTETCRREPWSAMVIAFLYGGTVAVLVSAVIEAGVGLVLSGLASASLIITIIIAPIVEESAKSTGVPRRRILELEDGFIYGAAVGLGFAATENMLYLISALSSSVEEFVLTAIIRAFTSTLLHASATAITGFGIALAIFARKQGRYQSWLPYLGIAIFLHALFNVFASLGDLVTVDQTAFALLGLALAFVLAIGVFITIRRRIRALDTQAPCVP